MDFISEEYIMRKLIDYTQSAQGKKRISKARRDAFNNGGSWLSKQKVTKVTKEIKDELAEAILRVIATFDTGALAVEIGDMDDSGQVRASISVDEDALHRDSLHYMNKNLSIGHGEGVHDILALFTHGYTLSRRPYGFWVRDNIMAEIGSSMERIGALTHRDPNPFLAELVAELNAQYGGTCKVTLNEKYMNGGGE